ncbi:hypothetical protein GCM10010207_64430 [Streptomyces atratus]|uniref:hypothetical protein n=1 Tax=Streptomyces atratus TaxID=1893 RepID=UPI0016714DE8|nr:hypothetical protein GCM10010207_64430 [Streptomyces atratus]
MTTTLPGLSVPAPAPTMAHVAPVPPSNAASLSVWPASTRLASRGDVAVGVVSLAEVAERVGTPVYLLDEGEVRERCRTYLRAFPDTDVVYAAKAHQLGTRHRPEPGCRLVIGDQAGQAAVTLRARVPAMRPPMQTRPGR